MYKNLLVPLDGTPLASATVEQAVAYAASTGARLTFLHARPDVGASGDGALLHAMSPQDFSIAAAGNAQAIVRKAEAAARAAGVPCVSQVVNSDHPHEAIIDAARSNGCDLVFMASHGRRGLQGALLGSVTRKVLQHATLPVLVSAVESNHASVTDEQRAIATLRDEHRSLAAILHALLARVDDTTGPVDPALLRAMLFYIEQFPERLHHPKEDAWLFRKLRERSSECDALLSELEQQHVAGARCFAELGQALEAGDRPAFRKGVHEFAEMQWRHMHMEESLVLPAASRVLQPGDWKLIAEAFYTNTDPRFGAGEAFENLASRLLELADRHRPLGESA